MDPSHHGTPHESGARGERYAMEPAPVLQPRPASSLVTAARSSADGQPSFVRDPLLPEKNARVTPGSAAPVVAGRRASTASLAVPQPSSRVHTVSPSALRSTKGGVGYYGGLLRAATTTVSRGNMPSATAGASGDGGGACSSRQQSPGYPSPFARGSPGPDRQCAEASAGQQQARERRHEAPPRVECELQYRRIEMGPISWSGKRLGESRNSPALGGASAARGGRRTSVQRTTGADRVWPVEDGHLLSSTRPILPNSGQETTGCDNNGGAAMGAIAMTTRNDFPGSPSGDRVFVSPPSAAAALVRGGQLPPAAHTMESPTQQPPTLPTAAALISASQAGGSLSAGSADSLLLKLDAILPSDSRRRARQDESSGVLGRGATHEMGSSIRSSAMGGANRNTETDPNNSGTTTCSRSNSATESDVGDINSADDGIAPILDRRNDGRARAHDVHTSSLGDPFGYGGSAGYRAAEITSLLPTSSAPFTTDGGDGLGSPAAGGAGHPQKKCGTWLDQLGATVWRDMLERRRRWPSVVLEVVIPLVCTTCAVVLWASFGVATSPNYSPLSSIGDRGFNFRPGTYRSALCYNETWFGERNYVDGLLPCRKVTTSRNPVTCDSVGEEELPVKGLCYTRQGRSLRAFVDGLRDGLSQVMPLDDMIAYQWLAKKLSPMPSSRSLLVGVGLASNSRFSAIQSSGKLYFAPRQNVPADMLKFLSASSKLLQYVYNDTFDTVEAAYRVIKSGERGPTWALVNIRQLDESGFDVSIEMASTALPRLEMIIDKAYPGGPSFDRSDVYYASGYPSLMNVLMKYYFSSLYAAGATRAEVDAIQALARRSAEQQQRTVSTGSVVVSLTTREMLDAARAVWEPVGDGIESVAGAAALGESLAAWTSQKASDILMTSAALDAKLNVTMYLGGMPWVPFKTSRVLTSASTILGFVIVLAFLYPVSQLTRRLVLEKERRVREAMLIMGLQSVHLWCSWLLHSVALMFVISFLMTVLMCSTLVTKSDAFSVLLVVLMFALTCVPLSGLLAAFFHTSRTAALMTPLIYFAMSLILFAMRASPPSAYLGLSIFSPTCFALIMQNLFTRESGDGFAASIFRDPSDNPNTATLLGLLVLDFFVYLIFMFYLDAVMPKSVGVGKHPLYFILDPIQHYRRKRREAAVRRASQQQRCETSAATSRSGNAEQEATHASSAPTRGSCDADKEAYGASCSWCCFGRSAASKTNDEDLWDGEDACDPDGVYEAEAFAPEQLSLRMVHLRKFFQRGGRRFTAVRNFCWQVPNTGISVLLGQNGAGKSTVMNMVTGMLCPDGGDCFIGGHSVRFDLVRARREIGYCPQHNILWPELSCREHLEFFARLKGLRGASLEDAVVHMLKEVDLSQKQNDPSCVLSGGMKRKLSVAIAFVGGSSLVLLDEPTAGMDVVARRHTWELLLRMSRSRSVLLTTHFMDEADLLGDRVAIMSRGRLKCAGSSLFLKSRLGLGYNISISADVLLNVRELDAFLQQHVPQTERLTSGGSEFSYRLPARYVERFPQLLNALDIVGPMIGIRGYAISPTTLEEIFVTIARDAAEDGKRQVRMKQEAHRGSRRSGYISRLWDRLRCCCYSSSGNDQSGGSFRDESDWGEVDWSDVEVGRIPYGHSNSDVRGNDRVRMQKPSGYSSQERGASPMQHYPDYSSEPARSTEPVVSNADCCASLEDVGCGHEALPPAAKYATTVLPMPAKRRAPVDIIWNCDISFSKMTIALLQTEAMVRKRFYNLKRDRKMLCFQIICPVACVLVAMLLSIARVYSVRELTMNTSNYPYNTLWDTTGCEGYFNSSSEMVASVAPNQRVRDVNMANISEYYYFLQDEWYAHGNVGKYSGAACGDPVVTMLPSIGHNPLVMLTNYSAYHEVPIVMANVFNLLLKTVRGPSAYIKVSAATLPSTPGSASEDRMRQLLVGIIIMVPFTFLPSNYVSWVVRERECKSRHLQDICGLRYLIYWFSNFIFDFAAYVVTMLLIVVIFAIFQRWEFVGPDTLGATLTLLSVYGFSSIATAYLVQFCFATHSSAQTVVMAASFVSGFFLTVVVFVLQLLPMTESAAKKMRTAFRIFPTFAVGEGIVNLSLLSHLQMSNPDLTAFSMDTVGWPCVYMAVEGPLFSMLTLLIDHPHWRTKRLLRHYDANSDAVALAKDHRHAEWAKGGGKQYVHPFDGGDQDGRHQYRGGGARAIEGVEEDSDVEDERVEVQRRMEAYRADLMRQEDMYRSGGIAESISYGLAVEGVPASSFGGVQGSCSTSPIIDAVAVVGLHKRYDSGKVAVHDLTFGVVPGEVFGLLGTNGAGKTTTMSIMCQEFYPTAGRVYVCGYDIISESRDALQCIGYCPQFDATLDLLTVEEHLRVFAGIRGISRRQQESVVRALLQLTGLREYSHTTSAALSGGNRRKLSVALSLIGGPPVVVFDEPSAGMDPVARREMWKSIQAIQHRCSIVLCTHHLEEIEALADCVAIMVDGRLRCIGSKVHLKQKYGSGFEMVIRVQPPSAVVATSSATADKGTRDRATEEADLVAMKARLISFVTSSFPSSTLTEVRGKRLVFTLPKNTNLANVFRIVQANREALHISDYTVSQTSIEQIFLRVSAEAKEEENARTAFADRQRDAESALRLKREQLHHKREKVRTELSSASQVARKGGDAGCKGGDRGEE